ncbi:hypothetical protein CU669_09230 [Paramagnetospirillum kuznetsovii]|uniref:HNH endonuclease n=1 Tax=Paramagnetospirillum kuznetsovii TaxID=2053833 RepID=A0A364NZH8_9PROT|nr:hypothetical protein [Paramagnetospirillum kuznetsovii]RAU22295.1 hypothetical protein CU669_09230 [Paramagnetospirillum kuznetsovii]
MADGVHVSVPVQVKGQWNRKAKINQEDLDDLLWGGCVNQWFLGHRGDNVLAHTPHDRVVPVASLIMKPPRGYQVAFKDGDPFNLTRANLTLVPSKTSDIPRG